MLPTPTPTPASSPLGRADAELILLSGTRRDLDGHCAPLREGLPAKAVAAIRCAPQDGIVKSATIYGFPSDGDVSAAYLARVIEVGLKPAVSGAYSDCSRAREGSYLPNDHVNVPPERDACFRDASGRAHYIAAESSMDRTMAILIEVIGKGEDLEAVRRWAWLGNLDQPGGPTVVWLPPAGT